MDCLVSSWKVNCPSLYFTIIHLEVCESLPISKNLTARKQSHPEADMTLWFQSNVKKHKNINISVKSNKKPTLVFKIFFLQIINFLTDFELRRWKRERGGGCLWFWKYSSCLNIFMQNTYFGKNWWRTCWKK